MRARRALVCGKSGMWASAAGRVSGVGREGGRGGVAGEQEDGLHEWDDLSKSLFIMIS